MVMNGTIVQNLVVNLIGKNNQAVFACQFGDFQQDFFAVYRAGRVIRVNHHNRFGLR